MSKDCMRCGKTDCVEVVAKAPDGSGAWEIYKCKYCNFGWRSTEPEKILDAKKWDPFFSLVGVDIDKLMAPCPIPPLKEA